MSHTSNLQIPGLVIAGLKGGTGKTVISLGITAAWRSLDISVSPFKKGPDYIDAGWLAQAAGRPCYNLDTFLCSPEQTLHTYYKHAASTDIAVIEGNRGLYDGIDTLGRTSTAEIAKLLNLPILLVLDCTKSTRTMAALLLGCIHFDPHVNIMGVILNQVAGKRHEGKVRDNIEQFCNIPVFGAIPKLGRDDFPERHMGLLPSAEHALAVESVKAAANVAKEHIDLETLHQSCIRISEEIYPSGHKKSLQAPLQIQNGHSIMGSEAPSELSRSELEKRYFASVTVSSSDEVDAAANLLPDILTPSSQVSAETTAKHSVHVALTDREDDAPIKDKERKRAGDPTNDDSGSVTIGIIKDSAFQFYYPDNLEALVERGAKLEFISPLSQETIPYVDAIYMGGGFPETHATQLAENDLFRKALRSLAKNDLPIYAECGGLIFLGKSLTLEGHTYPMTDILPLNFGLSKRPVGHGYTAVEVVNPNPFYEVGQIIRGHEFRYSNVIDIDYQESDMAFIMKRGKGIIHKRDGFVKNSVMGTYTHILAASTPQWADGLIGQAKAYKKRNPS